jgi:hypothetical protein
LCNSLPEIGGQIIVYFLHPSPGADEVSGESWQLATAAHGEGDGLTLCEQSSQGYDCTHHNIIFKVLLCSFL